MLSPRSAFSWLPALLGVLVLGVYAVAVLLSVVIYQQRRRPLVQTGPVAVLTVAQLPAGHLLRPADVRVAGLSGYTRTVIAKGTAVAPRDLTPTPDLGEAGTLLSVQTIPKGVADVELINVGSDVLLCKGRDVALNAKVQMLQCAADGTCRAALKVEDTKITSLSGVTSIHSTSRTCS